MISKYVDIPLDLTTGVLLKDEQVVLQRLRLLLVTEPGDMFDIPKYGTPIKQFLYEGITKDTCGLVQVAVRHSVTIWMGMHLDVKDVRVVPEMHNGILRVELDLYLKEFGKNITVVEPYSV